MKEFSEILIKNKDTFCVDGRKFYNQLSKGVKRDVFSQWMNRKIKRYSFIEPQDYISFYNTSNVTFLLEEVPRLEYQFGDMLDKITGFKWDRQYPIDGGKYRLDFKLGTTLIVEYDEEQHQYQEEKDKERIEYCQKWILENEIRIEDCKLDYHIPYIRVKKGQELEGIHKIIMHLIGIEVIYPWNGEGCLSKII